MVSTGLANAVVTGLVTGSIIAMGAIGLALVYSIAEVPNFAHGELLMLGAYLAFLVNQPLDVPLYNELTGSTGDLSMVGLTVLFVIAAGSMLAVIYLLGGRQSFRGEWWPIDVSPPVAVAINLGVAAVVGAIIVVSTPSIWGGMLLSMVVMAAFAPQLERGIFQKFRDKGADLATMLIVTLGLAFVIRYTVQAYFGATNRVYSTPDVGTVLDVTFPLSAAQQFNYYLTDTGVTLEWLNSAATGAVPGNVAVVGWSWSMVAGVFLAMTAAVGVVYWWRNRQTEFGGGGTFGPRVLAAVAGVIVFCVVGYLAAGPRTVPTESIYSTQIRLSFLRASVIAIAIVMMAFLHILLKETKLGIAMRASSDNLDLAKVTGINTDRVMMATWIVAGAYAAVGGVMLGILFSQIYPRMGFNLLLPMFAGVILGGVGSVYGAMLGSFLVGLSMDAGIYLLGLDVIYRVPFAFFILFLVLLLKPEGITGGN